MILCLCTGATDRDAQRAITEGHRCMAALQRCGIGTDCGSCHDDLRNLLRAAGARPAALWCHAGAPAEERQSAIA
ncbi:MAG: (2Fe-2S)-binding protein [Thermoanaerobaculia bacterium]